MVCVPMVDVPLSKMLCVVLDAFRLLSVRTRDSVGIGLPTTVGWKLMGRVHEVPAASVPGEEAELGVNEHSGDAPLERGKFGGAYGLLPFAGTRKDNAALPSLVRVTVCGLSVLVAPTDVEAKARVGGSVRSSFATELLPVLMT